MKNQKPFITVLLSIFIVVMLLMGCSKEALNTVETTMDTTEPVTLLSTEEQIPADNSLTALELVKLMGNGINLGNTMEAYGHDTLGTEAEITTYETLWGQPETTKAMIQGMKDAGFDTLRIPVAWTNAMDFESGDYTIGAAYLDRVEEIVNYALDAGLYVIVNDHWDGGWWGMYGSATETTRNSANNLYISMWTQIAKRFQDYSDKLIFESANEELGDRLNDVTVAEDSGTLSKDDCYQLTNQINQTFVDTIRSSEGHNSERFLLIAGYNTDITATSDERFKMPTDVIENKLLLSVHYYTPWQYCGTDSVTSWGTQNHYKEQNKLLKLMTKFTDMGYGIVIGEYAVLPTADGTIKDNTVDFYRNFLDNCDLYGYVPMLWDTNSFFKRDALRIVDTGIAELFKERSYETQASLTDEKVKANAQISMDQAVDFAAANNADIDKPTLNGDEGAVAWIMFNSNDGQVTYSVGDLYDPSLKTAGVDATDVEITGPGTYTIGLDFTGTSAGYANNSSFSAIGISNGELLYPGYIITITEITVSDMPYMLSGTPYTTTDDGKCTRLNLYNSWVGSIPTEARTATGDTSKVSATVMSGLGHAKNISITFEYGPAK